MCLPPVLPFLDPAAAQGAIRAWQALRALLLDAAGDPRAAASLPGRLPAAHQALQEAVLALGWSQLSALVARGEGDDGLAVEDPGEDETEEVPVADTQAAPTSDVGVTGEEAKAAVDTASSGDLKGAVAPVAAAPKAPAARLDASALQALQRSLNQGGMKGAAPVVVVAQGRSEGAEALRKAIGKVPPPTLDRGAFRNFLRQLEHFLGLTHWNDLRPAERRQLLTCLAARARWLQEGAAVDPSADSPARLSALFGRMRVLAARPTDGLVHGLARDHQPTTGSWHRDAVARWDEFVGEVAIPGDPGPRIDDALRRLRAAAASQDPQTAGIVVELLGLGLAAADPRLLRPLTDTLVEGLPLAVKVALQRLESAEDATDPPSGGRSLPADWPLLPRVQGKRVVLIGGDPRPEVIAGLIETFGFAALDWPALPNRAPRAIAQAAEQVRGGGYDIVFFLKRFAGHDVFLALRAATPKGTPFVVARTYGVGSLRMALERDFG